ncbi:hypothetical protein [Spirulina sp. 06S082]|uniref:hypothetical protein n=1 Tax=Spirulina sp. 06S082 TaxID=3110248 RepID=UPI002B221611|nr:hypothetical protein [Spirulina sp. 06S082]MEA5468082.1 hypothetical protein [Spirulina sp. 06S082]
MKGFSNPRSRFSIVTLIVLTASVVIPKSVNSQQIPDRNPENPYPEEIVGRFVNSCTNSATTQTNIPETMARSACQCMIWQIQDRYSFEDFATLSQRFSQDREAAQEFVQIVTACSPTPNS